MNKREALEKIEELKRFVEDCYKKNVVTQFPTDGNGDLNINKKWAMRVFRDEREGFYEAGADVSGNRASAFLADCKGQWYDKDGNKICGYLYYKPNE